MNLKSTSLLILGLTASSLCASEITNLIENLDSTDYEARQSARLELRQTLVSASSSRIRAYERELHAAITADQSFATRDWSIRMLELVGTGVSVKPLAALLNDPDERIVDLARRALAAIPASSADSALEKAALAAPSSQQAGFADALAYRGKPRARNELDDLLEAGSTDAALALGRIASRSSKAALLQAHGSAEGEFKEAVELALINAGLTNGDLAEQLATEGMSPAIRLGAFEQLLSLDEEAAQMTLATQLTDPESQIRRVMLRMAMQSPLRGHVVEQMPMLPATDQLVVLGSIEDFRYPQFESAVLELLATAGESTKPAAISALGVVGSDASFEPLLELYLADDRDRDVATALARLQAPSADQNLLSTAQGNGPVDERVAALRLLVLRNTDGVTELVNTLGRPGNPADLREAAFRGMEIIGDTASIQLLLSIVLSDDDVKRQAQGSLKKLSANLAVPDFLWTDFYAPAMAAAASDDLRRDVLVILDGNSGPAAADYLEELILSNHPLRPDAIRTLQRWTDMSGGKVWLALAATPDASATDLANAERGVIRLLTSNRISGNDYSRVELAKNAILATEDGDAQQRILDIFAGGLQWGMKAQVLRQFPELLDDPKVKGDVAGLLAENDYQP